MTGSVKCYEYEKHKKVSQHTLKKENAPEAIHFQGVYSYCSLSHQETIKLLYNKHKHYTFRISIFKLKPFLKPFYHFPKNHQIMPASNLYTQR